MPPGWWSEHVRPRDVYALLALLLLTSLCGFVWATGAGSDAKDVVVYPLGIVAGVGGYYSGARVADRATERADEKDEALAEATALVAALRQQLKRFRESRKEGPRVEGFKEAKGGVP